MRFGCLLIICLAVSCLLDSLRLKVLFHSCANTATTLYSQQTGSVSSTMSSQIAAVLLHVEEPGVLGMISRPDQAG